jgi:hypothetical protein
MNIFAVHENPQVAGASLPDKLITKMSTESLQLLTPWVFNTFGIKIEKPDASGHLNLLESDKLFYGTKGFAHHPCAKWLYESPSNVHWLLEHAFGINQEYWKRYDKYHGTLYGLNQIRAIVYKNYNKENSRDHTPFVQAMPEQYKDANNPVQAYRNYLIGEKGYAVWRHGGEPKWWDHENHKPARDRYLAEQERKRLERKNAKHHSVSRSLQT